MIPQTSGNWYHAPSVRKAWSLQPPWALTGPSSTGMCQSYLLGNLYPALKGEGVQGGPSKLPSFAAGSCKHPDKSKAGGFWGLVFKMKTGTSARRVSKEKGTIFQVRPDK